MTGHSYGGSVAVKIGKENPDVKGFGFNTGVGYKGIPEILKDKALCNVFRFKKRCYDNARQYTTKNGFDRISVISRLDGAKGRTRGKTGIDTHGIANITGNIEKEEIKLTERQIDVKTEPVTQNKPLEPVEPVDVETQEGAAVVLPRNYNLTRMHDDHMNGMYQRIFRNPIVIK